MITEIEEPLNNDWICEFEKIDQLYEEYYSEDIYYIKIHYVYLNHQHGIEKIQEEIFFLSSPNQVSKEEMIGLVKRNSLSNYSIHSLLQFNLGLEPEDMKGFLMSKNKENDYSSFLKPVSMMNNILFSKTMSMFHDLNSLYLLYLEKGKGLNEERKKKITRKLFVHAKSFDKKHKKTIRKGY
jgi:hypothetical protein